MRGVVALWILVTAVNLTMANKKEKFPVITADEIFGAEKIYRVETPYESEPYNVQVYINKIRKAYGKYTKEMLALKTNEKVTKCTVFRIKRAFLQRKSELMILTKVYMEEKGIKDDGVMCAIEIDLGRKVGKMLVPVTEVFLPEGYSFKDIITKYFRCTDFKVPPLDIVFYILHYQNKIFAPGIKAALEAAQEYAKRKQEVSTEVNTN